MTNIGTPNNTLYNIIIFVIRIYMEQKLDEMMNTLKKIEIKLVDMELKIDDLRRVTGKVEKDCNQMRNHIDFVENTYNIVRTPLNYLSNKINYMIKIIIFGTQLNRWAMGFK